MKYIIDKHTLDNAVFTYLDIMLGSLEKRKPKYYEGIVFAYPNQEFGILGWRNDNTLGVNYELVEKISDFFGLDEIDSEELIGRWFSNRLQIEVRNTYQTLGDTLRPG